MSIKQYKIVKMIFQSDITQPGLLKKIEEKLEKVGDVVQEKLEAAGNYIETEWNKHNFGPVLVRKWQNI